MDGEPGPADAAQERAVMTAVVTTGVGDFDRLEIREVPRPRPGPGEALVRVLAAGVNNTDINTRVGWYSSSVRSGTEGATGPEEDGGWSGATPFPLIQGADCCGRIEALGDGAEGPPVGARVILRACTRPEGFGSPVSRWLGTDFDGAFAQFTVVPASEAFAVGCDWSDAELASIPCAYGTAETMLHRAGVSEGMRVLVAGASGGVGSAAVQLARRRGAHVIGIAGRAKHEAVRDAGAAEVIERGADPVEVLGSENIDVVVDNVVGEGFGAMLEVLRRGGTYVTSGAIAGPVVELDMRRLYLKDLTLIGSTAWDEPVFPSLVAAIEAGQIRPLVARTYPLERIAEAQRDFAEKRHVGKLVLLPPA